jgi:hypothetical protein
VLPRCLATQQIFAWTGAAEICRVAGVSIRERKGDGISSSTADGASGFRTAAAPGKRTLVESTFSQSPAEAGGPELAPGKHKLVESLPVAPISGGLPHETDAGSSMVGQHGGAVASSHRGAKVGAPVQHAPARGGPSAARREPADHVEPPAPGINKPGFIDNSKGAPIYNTPAEAGGELVRDPPLPPAARVFVSGTHPRLKHWWYVTSFGDGTMVRGYVEDFRVNVALPEPFARLLQLNGGEKPEKLARENFSEAVRDGHDLRYYENVLLYVNRGRDGIQGSYQEPNALGRNNDNIKLYAGHRIWLVSPAYAKTLEGIVPSGSFTGGVVAKARRFAQHLEDILASLTEAPQHFGEVAGEFAQAIRDHMPAIVGITGAFLMAEAGSMFLAATPTGVTQAAAIFIQLVLTAFGAAGMVEAGIEALKHGSAWLTTAWTAHGRPEPISEASREFLRMFVAVAIAALSRAGAKANYRNALTIRNNMPTGGLHAFATVGGAPAPVSGAGTAAALGPGLGGPGIAGAAAIGLSDKEKAALGEGPDVDGLRDSEPGEARSRERRDRQAAEGRASPAREAGEGASGEARPSMETRTELAKHIPPPGDAFTEWFDSLSLAELDRLLADKSVKGGARGARDVIEECIRHPGDQHEWLMVAEARQFKKWGVSMRTIQEGRTFTLATIGKRFRHGGAGSSTMHRALRAMIRSSERFEEFLGKLNRWADGELVPSHSARWPHEPARGRYSLPDNLQVRSNP